MSRLASLFAAATLLASPAIAANYSAKPATAPAAKKIIGKDISWACGVESCTSNTDSSRPLIICQDLAKRTGRIESFTTDGNAMSDDQLVKCNRTAKGDTPTALAKVN